MVVVLLLIAVVGMGVSGLPAMVMGGELCAGVVISAGLNVVASLVGAWGLVMFGMSGETVSEMRRAWGIPFGAFAVGVDALGMIFLIPIFLVSALGAIYGLGYWGEKRHFGNGARLRVCWGLLAAAMAMVVLARDAVVFLMAWEVMALSAFMLVATEDHKGEVRKAAWVYLVATHIGTLCLFGFFAMLWKATGGFAIWDVASKVGGLSAGQDPPLTGMLILALVGFGMKAGLFPLHVWLPGAHANSPSHVSAVLSGVMLKMGVYGLFRATGLAVHPPIWWGALILGIGTVSALVGIAYAAGQSDYKRLLAYSSIENIGIVAMGLGLALLGQAAEKPAWVVLGVGAALFHVLNHSLFKPLLFMGAGSLLHAVHTRRMDRLGGLGKKMPVMFGLFVVGAVAICGLPPLNGFVSELLLYVGLLQTTQVGGTWGWAALAVPALAAVGAMAVTGFVKLLGAVFQGEPRGRAGDHAHDPGASMMWPMILLAAGCVAVGVVPGLVLPMVERASGVWAKTQGLQSLGLASSIGLDSWWWVGISLALGVGVMMVVVTMLMRGRTTGRAGTWDSGYARPTTRMQYTGASFVQMLVDLVAWAVWPRGGRLRLQQLFPRSRVISRGVPDVILDRVLLPAFSLGQRVVVAVRGIQTGSVQAYMVYVIVIIVLLVLVG